MDLFKKIKYVAMTVIVCITICVTEWINNIFGADILEKEVQ